MNGWKGNDQKTVDNKNIRHASNAKINGSTENMFFGRVYTNINREKIPQK